MACGLVRGSESLRKCGKCCEAVERYSWRDTDSFYICTAKEGGERAIEPDEYVSMNEKIAKSGYVDLVDVEAFIGDTYVEKSCKNVA